MQASANRPLVAITLDLDDTLWPVWPAIARAEAAVHAWLAERAPATARGFDVAGLRRLRAEVALHHPDRVHDLSAMRLESLRWALRRAGDDPALAEAAFDVFFTARQQVELYDDVAPALDRLASRYPLFALTNGNADLARTGVAGWFRGGLTAQGFGVGKPDARIFHAACTTLGAAPAQVLHVGDDLLLDVHAARAAGLQACWLRREPPGPEPAPAPAIPAGARTHPSLTALADALGC